MAVRRKSAASARVRLAGKMNKAIGLDSVYDGRAVRKRKGDSARERLGGKKRSAGAR